MRKFRLPRYQRVSNPPRMILTPRDREILYQVHVYRLMTREQIERLVFQPDRGQDHLTKTSKARKRLKLLYQHGLLDRIPTPVGTGTWAWRPVYRLARKGAELIASERGISARELRYWGRADDEDHRASKLGPLFLEHTLAVNDVRIAVTLAVTANGYGIDKWIDETKLKSQEMKDYATVTATSGRSLRVAVVPDAYFILNLGDRRAHFFLELDRATMSNQRWKTRVLAYQSYIKSGKYQERYNTKSLRILTVTTTPQRLANLKMTTAKASGKDVFWFTTRDQITPDTILFSPIWLLASDETDRSRKPLVS